MSLPTLEQLLAEAQAGESGALAKLFARFQPLVRRLLKEYRHMPVAEDLPGEAYLAFAQLTRQYDATRGIPFERYMARMLPAALHTVVRREWRRQARQVPMWEETTTSSSTARPGAAGLGASRNDNPVVRDFAEGIQLRETLRQMLAELPPRQAAVFIRRAVNQEEYPQIASALGNSPGTVRVLYAAARQRLQQNWRKISEEER
jgi:RNA polymerase sigma factor (sigma-70 family)